MKRKAIKEGLWVEAAEWKEAEYEAKGETSDEKFDRMNSDLQRAVSHQYFRDAAHTYEEMRRIDARKAASANLVAAESYRDR